MNCVGIDAVSYTHLMVITRSFHDDTGFTDQAFECFYQFTQLTGGVLYFKGCTAVKA